MKTSQGVEARSKGSISSCVILGYFLYLSGLSSSPKATWVLPRAPGPLSSYRRGLYFLSMKMGPATVTCYYQEQCTRKLVHTVGIL